MAAQLRRMLGVGYAAPIKSTAPWPDLPRELLGLVHLHMPSHAERVRVCAVCRSWRSGARLLHPLPPSLPWFALRDRTFLSLPDGAVHHMRVPDCGGVLYRVSTGSMLFLTTPLPINSDHLELSTRWDIRKVVVSDDLQTIVVLTASDTNSKNVNVYARVPQGTTAMDWAPPANSVALDIALFHGKLYVLTRDVEQYECLPDLHVIESLFTVPWYSPRPINMGIRSVQCIQSGHIDDGLDRFFFYLAASGNRLLTVGRIVDPHPVDSPMPSRCFKVFQAADLSRGHGWWSEVDTLMGHALFVSRGCSRSLAVRSQSCNGMSEISVIGNIEEDFLSSCGYNMRDQTVARLLSKTLVPSGLSAWGIWFPTWLFPAEV
ncbi:hypothetical protein VPH35_018388 [Triticum aestivum]